MAVLFVMCGIPGSGKSTWVQNNLKRPFDKHISRDEIRFSMIKEGENYFSKEDKVFDQFCTDITGALNKGFNVYADATHINYGSRKKLLDRVANYADAVIAIEMPTPVSVALERNEGRKDQGLRYVPPSAIKRMYNQYESPDYDEGFDRIYTAIGD